METCTSGLEGGIGKPILVTRQGVWCLPYLQLIEMTAGSANNIIGVFQTLQLPIDPISFLKKYVPFINWQEFEDQARHFANEKAIETELKSKADAKLQAEIMAAQQGGQPPGF